MKIGSRKRANGSADTLSKPSLTAFALEPRLFFDGAAAATADATLDAQAVTESGMQSGELQSLLDAAASYTPTAAATESAEQRHEILFIESNVVDYQALLAGAASGIEVHLLDAGQNGLAQIADILDGRTGIDAIHIVSHGSAANVELGSLDLGNDNIADYADALRQIGNALSADADILLYGCDIAEGSAGAALIDAIAQYTGADVAASSDNTGSSALGGDWNLEHQVGAVEIPQAFSQTVQQTYGYVLAAFTENFDWSFGDSQYIVDSDGGTAEPSTYDFTASGATFRLTAASNGDGTAIRFYSQFGEGNSNSLTIDSGGGSPVHNSGTTEVFKFSKADGSSWKLGSIWVDLVNSANVTLTAKLSGSTVSTQTVSTSGGVTVNFSSVTVDTLEISGTDFNTLTIDTLTGDTTAAAPIDATSTVAAGAGSEASSFSTTATSSGTAVSLLDFSVSDLGTSDGVATTISAFTVDVSGTSTDAERANMVFLLNGPDASNVQGTYNSATDKITFSSLSLSIADGGTETYTISAYYNDNAASNDVTDGHTLILSTNASAFTTGSGSSTMASSQANVTTGSGAVVDVTATQLVFSQNPSGTVTSGGTFATQPIVQAVDARGNLDTGYTTNVSLSESGSGILGGTTTLAASAGIATFTNVSYTAASDADANFTLSASSGSLTGATSSSINPDVVATRLVFSTQPASTSITSGVSTGFTTVPVVSAVDADGIVDTDYATNVVLSVTDPNDGTVDGTINSLSVSSGDQDGSGSSVTLSTASTGATYANGVATFTALSLQYTNSGSSNVLALRASSGALTAVNSNNITSTVNNAPVITSNSGGASASINVAENGTAVTTVAASDADAGTTLTYSIVGGTDAGLFSIDVNSGVLTFLAAPDYETPGDSGADNVYDVSVQAMALIPTARQSRSR